MQPLIEQTLTLAAICQVSHYVQRLSRHGQINDDELTLLLKSIMVTSPENTLEVYGGEYANIKVGLETLSLHLGNNAKQKIRK